MENYREKLKIHNILYGIGALALLAIQVLAFTGIVSPVGADERWHGFYNGFIAGAAFGVMALFIVGLILNLRALRNEKAMKKQYIKETDERSRQIAVMGKSAGATLFLLLMVPAAIILGYFNVTVFITCIGCVKNTLAINLLQLAQGGLGILLHRSLRLMNQGCRRCVGIPAAFPAAETRLTI